MKRKLATIEFDRGNLVPKQTRHRGKKEENNVRQSSKNLPSQTFVDNLEQFKLSSTDWDHKNVLIQFTSKSQQKFVNFFEVAIQMVLNVSGDFFELINSLAIKDIAEEDVKQFKICVRRVTNHNHGSWKRFRSFFIRQLTRLLNSVKELRSKEPSQDALKLIVAIKKMRNAISKVKRSEVPKLIRKSTNCHSIE